MYFSSILSFQIIILILKFICHSGGVTEDQFSLKIIHINDFHSRYDEINSQATKCKSETEVCLGGYARTVAAVKSLKFEAEHSIFLNAGDNFQGTLWYDKLKGNTTSYFLNLLPCDAMTLGNHEFDDGVEGILPFLSNIQSPVVVCNLDDDEAPSLKGLHQNSVILNRGGRKIAVIGVLINSTDLSRPGKVKFLDEIESVRAEIANVKQQSVDIIVLLSHCGLKMDREIANVLGEDIHVIVGGHSHSLLYKGTPPSADPVVDTYPIEVEHGNNGKKTLIVQALAFSKFVGNLTVVFDQDNKIVSHEGNPIYMDGSHPADPEILEEMKPFQEIINAIGNEQISYTNIDLEKLVCHTGECPYGNLINDAYVDHYVISDPKDDRWTSAPIAFSNAGIIRVGLNRGNITFDDLATSHPYDNTVDTFDIRGDHLLEALEISASKYSTVNFLQFSGLRMTIDVGAPVGERVKSVKVRCNKCRVPRYEDLEAGKYYRIAIASWIGDGGNGYTVFGENRRNLLKGPTSLSVVENYMRKMSPIVGMLDGRLRVLNSTVDVSEAN